MGYSRGGHDAHPFLSVEGVVYTCGKMLPPALARRARGPAGRAREASELVGPQSAFLGEPQFCPALALRDSDSSATGRGDDT